MPNSQFVIHACCLSMATIFYTIQYIFGRTILFPFHIKEWIDLSLKYICFASSKKAPLVFFSFNSLKFQLNIFLI